MLVFSLLRLALQHLMVSLVTERLLKDVLLFGLEKLSKRTDNHVDDDILLIVKRALYPEFQENQPIAVAPGTKKVKKSTKKTKKRKKTLAKSMPSGKL